MLEAGIQEDVCEVQLLSSKHCVSVLLEQKDVRLRIMDFIVFPTKTLCDTQASPFLFPEQLQCAFCRVEIFSRNSFEHCLWQLDMSIFVFAVAVSGGVLVSLECEIDPTDLAEYPIESMNSSNFALS